MSSNAVNLPAVNVNMNPRPTMILGSSGLKHHAGFIDEEFLHRLRGRNAIKIYREMIDNSPIIASALYAIKMLIRQVEWRVEPADESEPAKAEAEEVEGALEDMSHTFEDFLSEILSFIWAGYSTFEIIYKLRKGPNKKDPRLRSDFDDGKWGWRKIEIRSQDTLDRWVFDEEGGLLGFIQQNIYTVQPGTGFGAPVFIPIDKALLFKTESFKGNPEGKSLIRPAVIPYWYVKRIQEIEAIGIERNLAGMPIMQVPAEMLAPNPSDDLRVAKAELEKFVTQIRMDERWGGLVPSEVLPDGNPSGYKFELVQSSGRRLVDTDVSIKRYRAEMLMLFMAQFLTMGTEKVGSFSLASNMTELFGVAIGTIMDTIAAVINRYMIPRRQRLNKVKPELDPFIVHGDIEGPELDKVGGYIQQLAASGMIEHNRPLERKLLEIGGLPQPPEEEEELSSPTLAAPSQAQQQSAKALSDIQIKTIMEINKAIKNGDLTFDAGKELAAAGLGVAPKDVVKFLVEATEEGVNATQRRLGIQSITTLYGDGKVDRPTAITQLAAILGVDEKEAAKLIPLTTPKPAEGA